MDFGQRILHACFLVVVLAAPGWTTPALMEELPSSTRFGCIICHDVQEPAVAEASLNVFGVAFKANGNKWNKVLAAGNSDGDSCSNGFELGDENGDHRLDEGVTEELNNPGADDCVLAIRSAAWTKLKELFR